MAQDRIKVFAHLNGSVVLLPKLPVSALRGIVAGRRPTVTIDEMHETVGEAASDATPRARP